MREAGYDRQRAAAYAVRWAMGRNPAYYDFTKIGGDCTNFVSQCLFAGSGIMNFTPVTGWFYRSADDRTASWTGVEYLYRFLMGNRGPGPYAELCRVTEAGVGDVVQLADAEGKFYHCLLVLRPGRDPLVAAHDFNALYRPLSTYSYTEARFLHVLGSRP